MATDLIKRWFILGGLLAITLWLVWSTPNRESNIAIVEPTRQIKPDIKSPQQKSFVDVDADFTLAQRKPLTEDTYDLFEVAERSPIKLAQRVIPVVFPRVKPSTPPFPFTYIGKLTEEGVTQVFLLKEQTLLIIREGDKVGSDFQLKEISEKQLRWTFLPLNTTQNMSIGKTP